MKKILFLCALALCLLLCSCGGDTNADESVPPLSDNEEIDAVQELRDENESDYSEVQALFDSIVPDSAVKTSLKNGRLYVTVNTTLTSSEAPEDWEHTVALFEEGLISACENADAYGATTVFVEIQDVDGNIMASGYNNEIRFNMFGTGDSSADKTNPPTISKFEYDQISVGMSLEKVREIIGGPGVLQSQIGEVSDYNLTPIRTYRWYGTREGSYADILFDGYEVYSKVELWLE